MADLTRRGDAAQGAADALLRAVGGRAVLLRMATPAVAGDVTEQLGAATPGFVDAELAPVVFRRTRPTVNTKGAQSWELLVSATALAEAVGTTEAATVLAATGVAVGVVVDGLLLEIESASYSDVAGVPYVYRLQLREAATSL